MTTRWVVTVLALGLAGCPEGAERCVEGATVVCACPGGKQGAQTCLADGTFDACDCGADPVQPGTDSGIPSAPDAGEPDAGEPDAGAPDAGAPTDAGTEEPPALPPVVGDLAAATRTNRPVEIDLLAHVTHPQDRPVHVATVSTSGTGTVTLLDDGRARFQPGPNFLGEDTFTFTVEDDREQSASGTVTVDVTARVWSDPVILDHSLPGSSGAPHGALDADGVAFALWAKAHSGSASNRMVWSRRFHPETGWSDASHVESDDTRSAQTPTLLFDDEGGAAVLFAKNDGGNYRINSNLWTAGAGWGIEQVVHSRIQPYRRDYDAILGRDGAGRLVAVWRDEEAPYIQRVFTSIRTGSSWSPPVRLQASLEEASNLQASFGSEGGTAIWGELQSGLWAATFRDGAWQAPTSIAADVLADRALGGTASGSAVLGILTRPGDGYRMEIRWFTPATGWTAPSLLEEHAASVWVTTPAVARDEAGGALLVWQEIDDDDRALFARRHVPGSGWTQPERITPEGRTAVITSVRAAVDEHGNGWVLWKDGFETLRARRYDALAGWEPEIELDAPDHLTVHHDVSLSTTGTGDALVVFTQSWDASHSEIHAIARLYR